MMPLIFISYLRATGAREALLTYQALSLLGFQPSDIYLDTEFHDLVLRGQWEKEIPVYISGCHFVLAVIDPGWATYMRNLRRGNQTPEDVPIPWISRTSNQASEDVRLPYMCHELALAVKSEREIIPLRFDDAPIPNSRELPAGAAEAAKITAVPINFSQWRASFEAFVPRLRQLAETVRVMERELRLGGRLLKGEQLLAARGYMPPEQRVRFLLGRKAQVLQELGLLETHDFKRMENMDYQTAADFLDAIQKGAIRSGKVKQLSETEAAAIENNIRWVRFR
jgi:hypothetical protein